MSTLLFHLHRWVRRHLSVCFVLMTLAFVLFGALSLDLVRLFSLHWNMLLEHGRQVVMDGDLQQLAELLPKALAANGAYLFFKWCEHLQEHALSDHCAP